MSIREVALYVLKCDTCEEDFNDGYAYMFTGDALEEATEYDWLITANKHTCFHCIRCEVCGEQGYPIEGHGVCDEHEDHDFSEATDVDR